MRITKFLITAVLLGTPGWAGAQAGRPAAGAPPARPSAAAPEVFTATAQAKNATGAVSGTLEVRVSRYTPDFDRTTVETALRLGGYPQFLIALRKAPEVGQLVLAGGQPYVIRYARETVEAGARTLVMVTDRPVLFLGGGREGAKPRAGYEVGVLRIELGGSGAGRGTMAAAARVRPDGQGGVVLDDYAEEPIALTNVTRKPL